ncbi:PAS domain-containing hybrid sensor histidine kinase/response regulator [Undibacterium macrobrachii]|jgi:PAS domain S-box-containing protein|uniref:histidine kinase n=1 Tax=Undibacterium macrobrachii TaxID=1119058 RepID=A0ABQ2XB74_9BURK|nr:PAS domain S-box protein [Undibacterium macrobrachii]GGX08423.1 histidine kinase [Undibacterium macrobrachii]
MSLQLIRKNKYRHLALLSPIALLVSGLVLTTLLYKKAEYDNRQTVSKAADALLGKEVNAVVDRLWLYQYGLRGARGAIIVDDTNQITRKKFRRYADTRDIAKEFPGARGFGFIRRVKPENELNFLQQARLDDAPQFSIRQLTPHMQERFVIQYVEPAESNAQAIGLDIASEINRRTAAIAATRSGLAVMTGPITLVQLASKPKQSFLFLLPIYATTKTPPTEEERNLLSIGWSYAVLSMQDILTAAGFDRQLAQLSIADITNPQRIEPFYDSYSGNNAQDHSFLREMQREVFGRVWKFSITVSPKFIASLPLWSLVAIQVVGIATSFLAAISLFLYLTNRRRVIDLDMTRRELALIVESSTDAIIGKNLDGVVTSWNKGAEVLFGYTAAEACGRSLLDLIIPKEAFHEEEEILTGVRRGEHVASFNTVRQCKDGKRIDVLISVAPIIDHKGQLVGASKTVRDITELKSAERKIISLNSSLERQVQERTVELEAAKRDLQTVLDSVPSIIGYWDKQLINRVANHAYQNWFGVDHKTLPGTSMLDLLGPQLFQQNLTNIEAVLRGEPQLFERAIVMSDGKIRHSLAHYLPDLVDGEVKGFYSFVHDVTELVENRQKLDIALSEYQILLDTINRQLLYSVTDAEGTILEVNDYFCQVHGFEEEDLIGKTHRILNSASHPPIFWKTMWQTLLDGQVWNGEICNKCADGSLRWFDTVIAPHKNAQGDIEKFIALRIDITTKQEQQRALSAARDQMVLAAEVAQLGVWTWDVATNALSWNQQMYRMYDYDEEQIGSHLRYEHWRSRVHPDDIADAESQLHGAVEGRCRYTPIFRVKQADGSYRFVQAGAYVERDKDGKATLVTGINLDITERKEFETNLVRAKNDAEQASVAKGQFLANMSHEIRTPMNAVLGMLQLLRQTKLGEQQADYAIKAQSAARSLLSLLNDILDFSKIEAGKFELSTHHFELEQMMRELGVVLSGNLGQKNVELMFDLSPNVPNELTGDQMRLQQVLINLAGNAIKFTSEGLVIVGVQLINRVIDNAILRFSVSDTGIGISKEQQLRIFEGFNQAETSTSRRFGGTGLGLTISKRLVEMMGGTLFVESEIGKGSRFWFDIPLQISVRESRGIVHHQGAQKKRILVVDDNPISTEIITAMFAYVGWDVMSVDGGYKALALVNEQIECGNHFDAIVMDWRMQDIDGMSAAFLIKKATTNSYPPAIVMLTGFGREVLAEVVGKDTAPFVAFLTKPVTPAQLIESIENAISPKAIPMTQAAAPAQRLEGVKLLVVEDNPLNRQVVDELMKSEGALVTLADGGLSGVILATESMGVFDLVIMDVQMPDMDGLEATRRIRADYRFTDLPILAMTANVSQEDRLACMLAGMNGHVGKPIDMEEVVPIILDLVKREPFAPINRTKVKHFDEESLTEPQEHILRRFGGNKTIYRTILDAFVPEYDRLSAELNLLIVEGSNKQLAEVLHALKGVASTVGAAKLAKIATELEQRAKEAPEGQAKDVLTYELLSTMTSLVVQSNDQLNRLFLAATPAAAAIQAPKVLFTAEEREERLQTLKSALIAGNMNALDLIDTIKHGFDESESSVVMNLEVSIRNLKFDDALAQVLIMLKRE